MQQVFLPLTLLQYWHLRFAFQDVLDASLLNKNVTNPNGHANGHAMFDAQRPCKYQNDCT